MEMQIRAEGALAGVHFGVTAEEIAERVPSLGGQRS